MTEMKNQELMLEDGMLTEEENKELTKEQIREQTLMSEKDMLSGLLDASGFSEEEEQRIDIKRNGRLCFSFTVRPLTEKEYNKCRKAHTKYVRNKQFGVKMPEETDTVKYRSLLIYTATVEADKKRFWDNKDIWKKMVDRGQEVVTATDVIDYTLRAGEKDRIIEVIDSISGFDDEGNLEEVAKN